MEVQNGYFGLTDPEWYSYLAQQPKIDEVNFWQPHGNRAFRAIKSGEIFFFKLRAPAKAIAGFGFFQRYEAMPAWLAWECFGEMNGAPNSEIMIDRIVRLRGDGGPRSGDFKIGCIMVASPVFFSEEEWVTPPADWPISGIQQGKTYDLRSGEGSRVFQDCLACINRGDRYWNVEHVSEEAARYGNPILVSPRLGQGLFKLEVRDAYHGACAVTGEHSGPVLEASHIIPYGKGGAHRIDNGLLLRSDLHRLFDRGYVTVTPDYRFLVGDKLRQEFNNGKSYYGLNGTKIFLPERASDRPKREFLEWHQKELFTG